MSAIFISHRSTDNAVAGEIHDWLEANGHRSIFLDFDPADGIPAGRSWEQELYHQLRSCRAVIVLCSEASASSRWMFAEVTQARALGKHILPVSIDGCRVDSTISDRQVIDLTKDRDVAFERLSRGLLKAGIDPQDAFDWDGSRPPFPGLLAFQEDDAAVFFGRSDEITEGLDLLNRVRRQNVGDFAMVLGASGSGKSSLVRAGIVPRLKRDTERWLVVGPFRPRDDPARELAGALHTAYADVGDPRDWREISDALHAAIETDASSSGNPLVDMATELRVLSDRSDAKILFVVDQFEELLDYPQEHRATRFLKLLRDTAEAEGMPAVMLGTMRSDFLGVFQNSPVLLDVEYQSLSIGPLSPGDVRQVIERPAQIAGLELEAGLAELMVADTETEDALPLLAFALRRLYEEFGTDGRMDMTEYSDGLGGLSGAVASVADEVIESERLDDERLEDLRRAFLTMVRLTDEGRWARRVTLWENVPESVQPVLNHFVTTRLLVSSSDGDTNTLEVAHEALFRSWQLLTDWLSRDAQALQLRQDLQRTSESWSEDGRSTEYLWRGARLAHAVELMNAGDVPLEPIDRSFIEASEDARQFDARQEEKRRRRRLQIAAVIAIGASALAVVALVFFFSARRETTRANQEATRAEEQATIAQQQSTRAEEQRIVAEEQRIVAEEQRVVAEAATGRADDSAAVAMAHQAQALISTNPALAVAVATEAQARSDDPEAELAVIRSNAALRDSPLIVNLDGHTDRVEGVAYNHDGTRLATASNDGTAKIWDTETGVELHTLSGHTDWVRDVVFSPEGSLVATASDDTTARIWDTSTGQELLILEGHADWVRAVAFSPDGTLVATVSDDATGGIWDTATGQELHTLFGHTDWVNAVAFSPDGAFVATASDDTTARIWDTATGQELHILEGHTDWVNAIAFSPDGTLIATVSDDTTAGIWDAATGEELQTLFGHTDWVNDVAFSPDGTLVATASVDETARIWDAVTGGEQLTLSGHTNSVSEVVFSPDSDRVTTASDDQTAKIWDTQAGRELTTFTDHTDWVRGVAFNHDGTLAASASDDTTARIWDPNTGVELLTLSGHTDWVRGVAFSPDGTLVATASDDTTARIWNSATGQTLRTLQGHTDWVKAVSFNDDGSLVATASDDTTAIVWDATTGEELRTLEGHADWVNDVVFTPDGTLIATASDDGTARIWTARTGTELLSLSHGSSSVRAVAFNHDGAQLATAGRDGTVRIWDTTTGEVLLEISGHTGSVSAVAFNNDGTRLATAGKDKTARVWDARSGVELFRLIGHDAWVHSVEFNHDGTRIVTGGEDSTAKVWDATTEQSCDLVVLLVTKQELTDILGGVEPIACVNLRP